MTKLFLLLFLTSCIHKHLPRSLSTQEMQTYNLNGIINDARICPTRFNDKTQSSQIIGRCELVTCEEKNKKIECWAKPEN